MNHSARLKQRPVLEIVEDRCLLAAPITEFPIPDGSRGITAGPDGSLWFTLLDDQIGRITPAGQVTEFSIPSSSSGPDQITAGPDGNLWFTYGSSDYKIGRITPSGQVTVFPTPTANQSSAPSDIAAGPDGNLWFTETTGDKIGRITPAGLVTEFAVSDPPGDISAGPDGNVWFTETEPIPPQFGRTDTIGRVTPAGQVTEFPLDGFLMTNGAAFGNDGNLWFIEGTYVPFPGSSPGAKERLEFLCRITPAGQITKTPLSGSFSGGDDTTFGADGDLWYAAEIPGSNAIGRVTPAGLVTEFSIPTIGSGQSGIVAGPDGNIWFSEAFGDKIGRFQLATTDLRLTTPAPTITGTAGQPLTYTISVTNDGPIEATDVVLTEELPTPAVPIPVSPRGDSISITASQGTVEQVAGGGFDAEFGNLASGATATVTIVMTFSGPRTITSRLAIHANESDTDPGNDLATLSAIITPATAPSNPPHVLRLQAIRSKRKGLTAIVVAFDQPMASGRVSSVGIYHLVSVGKGKRPRLKAVGLASASYDAPSRSVRLTLRKPFKTGTLRLTIDHAGAVAPDGMGLGGGDFIATVPR
jgi:uncharacterized repeat protein (TIGR01451 family)